MPSLLGLRCCQGRWASLKPLSQTPASQVPSSQPIELPPFHGHIYLAYCPVSQYPFQRWCLQGHTFRDPAAGASRAQALGCHIDQGCLGSMVPMVEMGGTCFSDTKSLNETSKILPISSFSTSYGVSRRVGEEALLRDLGDLGSRGSATAGCVFPGKSLCLAGPHLPHLCHRAWDWIDSQFTIQKLKYSSPSPCARHCLILCIEMNSPQQPCEVTTIIIPIFSLKKLRHREVSDLPRVSQVGQGDALTQLLSLLFLWFFLSWTRAVVVVLVLSSG